MKDHEKRELVKLVVGIAKKYSLADQHQISRVLDIVFSALSEATARAERAEEELKKAREQEWGDFAASVAENKLFQQGCVCDRCEWTRTAIALLQESKS